MKTTHFVTCIFAFAALVSAAACGDETNGTSSSSTSSSSGSSGTGGNGTGGTGTGGTGTGGAGGGTSAKDYYNGDASRKLGAPGNEATCATCHSDDGSQDGFSGNTLKDIAYHTSYKGGMAATLLLAANACIEGWMGGTPLVEGDASWDMLKSYLESISSPAATTPNMIAPEVLADEAAYAAAYTGGDAVAGAAKYDTYCGKCHTVPLTVGKTAAPAKDTLKVFMTGRIAQQVRTSGPPPSGLQDPTDSTPGPMPFFELKDLAAKDLADVIAHIQAQ